MSGLPFDFTQQSRLDGRTALITGGAGNIGRRAASAIAGLGASVIILDVDEAHGQEIVEDIRGSGGKAFALGGDLSDASGLPDLAARAQAVNGGIDILINSAALVGTNDLQGWAVQFEKQLPEAWDQAIAVNLRAPFFLIQACLPALRRSGHGSVVNLCSIYGELGPDWRLYDGTAMGNPGAYAASKGGLSQLTRWLATTLAPDVRVNGVSIGGVWRNQPESFVRQYESRTPLGRMAHEDDIAAAVAFLAGDLSSYVTGQVLAVDGGWSAW